MNPYDDAAVEAVMVLFGEAVTELGRGAILSMVCGERMSDANAKMYLTEGVARRLSVMERCVRNVFAIHPVSRADRLPLDSVQDININLQAFVVNLIGVQDNLAWAFVHKNSIELDRVDVALHRKKFRKRLPRELRLVLTEQRFVAWHDRYARAYRDALAHRIPFFVPPAEYTHAETEEDSRLAKIWVEEGMFGDVELAMQAHEKRLSLGQASHRFFNLSGPEPDLLFHGQLLRDARTTHHLVHEFAKHAFNG